MSHTVEIGTGRCPRCQATVPVVLQLDPIGDGTQLRAKVLDVSPHRVRVSYGARQFVRFAVDAASCHIRKDHR